MNERALRIELADLEDDFKTLLPRQHEHENPKILKQLQERILNIKTQLRSMRKPVTRQPEKKAEKIEEKVVEKNTKIQHAYPYHRGRMRFNMMQNRSHQYTHPTPMQALFINK